MTKKKKKNPELRPKKHEDTPLVKPAGPPGQSAPLKKRVSKHGIHTLQELLKGDIDGRYWVAKRRDQLEAQWIDHCGGPDRLTPGMLSLIKRITTQEILLEYAEKVALLGMYEPDNNMQARINSQRLNILALEQMIEKNKASGRADYEDILKTITQDEDE